MVGSRRCLLPGPVSSLCVQSPVPMGGASHHPGRGVLRPVQRHTRLAGPVAGLCCAQQAGPEQQQGVFRPSRGVPPRLREARGCRVSSAWCNGHCVCGCDVWCGVACLGAWGRLRAGDQAPSRGQAALLSETFVGVGGVDGGGGAGALGQS
jgi:hypothetical protein